MKIAVLSDTHDNIVNLIKALTLINKENVSALIHCGDVCDPKTLELILDNFKKKIYLVLGNCDLNKNWDKFKEKRIKIFNNFGSFKLNNKKIGITHFPDFAYKEVKDKNYGFIFYGHTHKPWEEKLNNTFLINPGNIAGIIYRSTFALLDLKNFDKRLVIL